jgi:hypothetical protein
MKKLIITFLFIIGLQNTSQAQKGMVTWDNCATKGESSTLYVYKNYPKAYKRATVFVIHKLKKMNKSKSKVHFIQELNKQCFGFYMILQYVNSLGTDAYTKNIEPYLFDHGAFIEGEFYTDEYNLSKSTLSTTTKTKG